MRTLTFQCRVCCLHNTEGRCALHPEAGVSSTFVGPEVLEADQAQIAYLLSDPLALEFADGFRAYSKGGAVIDSTVFSDANPRAKAVRTRAGRQVQRGLEKCKEALQGGYEPPRGWYPASFIAKARGA